MPAVGARLDGTEAETYRSGGRNHGGHGSVLRQLSAMWARFATVARRSPPAPAHGPAHGPNPRDLALHARELSARGAFEAAAPAWRDVLAAKPDNHQALARLAEALWRAGDAEGAIAPLRRALALRPDDGFTTGLAGRIAAGRPDALGAALQRAFAAPDGATPADALLTDALIDAAPAHDATRACAVERAAWLDRAGPGPEAVAAWVMAADLAPTAGTFAGLAEALDRVGGAHHAARLRALATSAPADAVAAEARAALLDIAADPRFATPGEPLDRRLSGYAWGRAALVRLRGLAAAGDAATALARFAGAIDDGPPPAADRVACEVALQLSLMLSARGRAADATRLIEGAAHDADPALLLRARLRAAVAAGDVAGAEAAAWRAVEAVDARPFAWREAVAEFAAAGRLDAARRLFRDSARLIHAGAHADWLAVAGAAPRNLLGPEIRELLRGLDPADERDRLEAARFALRHGGFDAAGAWLAVASEPLSAAFAEERRRLERARALLDRPVGDAALPEDAYGALAARAVALAGQQSGPAGGPALLVTRSLAAGGAERQLAVTAVGLARRLGDPERVRVVCSDLRADPARRANMPPLLEAGVAVDDLARLAPGREAQELDPDLRDLLDLIGPDLARPILALVGAIERHRPSVVHLWQDRTCVEGAIAALIAGAPRIVMSTRSTRPVTHRRLTPYLEPAFRALLRSPRVRMTNNSTAGARDYEAWLGLADGAVATLRNGFDFAAMNAAGTREAAAARRAWAGVPSGAPLVGGVMRLADVKNPLLWVETAARVAAALPEARFVLVGDGPLRDAVERRAAELGLGEQLTFAGFADPAPWYAAMDALLLTSRTEGLPNVTIEAQAMGVPVVATRVGGIGETVEDEITGWLVDAHEAGPLAERLVATLSDPDWRAHSSAAARSLARGRYSLDAMIDATLAQYR